jgi:uncharacterized RDD family membrane protein YckC
MTDPRDPGTPQPSQPQPPETPETPETPVTPPPAAAAPSEASPAPSAWPPAAGSGPPASPPSAWPAAAPPPGGPTTPVAWDAPKEEPGPAPGIKFASHGLRLVAYIIDGLIVGLVFTVILLLLSTVLFAGAGLSGFWEGGRITQEDLESGRFTPLMASAIAAFGLFFLFAIIVTLAYFPFFWARSGQTPGMRLFGLYVVRDSDGGRISGGQAILRLIGMWVAAIPFYLGFIWVFIDARRRGWHDLIAGTVVIERSR